MRRFALTSLALVAAAVAVAQDAPKQSSIEGSLTFVTGNSESESVFLFGQTKRAMSGGRFNAYFAYNFGKQSFGGPKRTTTNNLGFGARFEKDFGIKSFWYASADWFRDDINGLDLRNNYGLGLGYTVKDEEVWGWRVSAGLSFVDEDYVVGRDRSFTGLELGSQYRRNLSSKLSLTHDFRYIPNSDDFEDYVFTSNLGLAYAISSDFNVGLRYIIVHDETPAAGFLKETRTLRLTIGVKF